MYVSRGVLLAGPEDLQRAVKDISLKLETQVCTTNPFVQSYRKAFRTDLSQNCSERSQPFPHRVL